MQLREIEALRKSGLLRLGRQDGVRFIHALVPPELPCGVAPQVSTVTPFIGHRIDRLAFLAQRAGRARLMIVEVLNAVSGDPGLKQSLKIPQARWEADWERAESRQKSGR